jgi:hypothetical protein
MCQYYSVIIAIIVVMMEGDNRLRQTIRERMEMTSILKDLARNLPMAGRTNYRRSVICANDCEDIFNTM